MARIFNRLGCLIGRHSPSRRSVQYVGHLKVGPCRDCGADLEKGRDGRWIRRRSGSSSGED